MNWVDLLFSLLPLALAWRLLRQIRLTRRLQRAGSPVPGLVTGQREVSTRNGPRFVPTIRFTTYLGQVVEGESQGEFTKLELFDGDEVSLLYDPDDPARFLLVQELAGWGTYLLGGAVLLLALLSLPSALGGR